MPLDVVGERKQMDARVQALLQARNEVDAITALRRIFVEELDFDTRSGAVGLTGEDLPPRAARIAERDGVQIVTVRLLSRGRVLVRDIREALKQLRNQLSGDILLVAGDAEGSEWQLVYPTTLGGKEVLRRIVLHRGQPHRTVIEQLTRVYEEAQRRDL